MNMLHPDKLRRPSKAKRRMLLCERLESRNLLHGIPVAPQSDLFFALALGFEVETRFVAIDAADVGKPAVHFLKKHESQGDEAEPEPTSANPIPGKPAGDNAPLQTVKVFPSSTSGNGNGGPFDLVRTPDRAGVIDQAVAQLQNNFGPSLPLGSVVASISIHTSRNPSFAPQTPSSTPSSITTIANVSGANSLGLAAPLSSGAFQSTGSLSSHGIGLSNSLTTNLPSTVGSPSAKLTQGTSSKLEPTSSAASLLMTSSSSDHVQLENLLLASDESIGSDGALRHELEGRLSDRQGGRDANRGLRNSDSHDANFHEARSQELPGPNGSFDSRTFAVFGDGLLLLESDGQTGTEASSMQVKAARGHVFDTLSLYREFDLASPGAAESAQASDRSYENAPGLAVETDRPEQEDAEVSPLVSADGALSQLSLPLSFLVVGGILLSSRRRFERQRKAESM